MGTFPIPQPDTPTYPATDLDLFATLSRGLADPPYDKTKRPKYWKDPAPVSDPTVFKQYLIFHQSPVDGSWIITNIYMMAVEAAVTNFPDAMPEPAPTLPAWEMPVRALLPNEKLLPTPFGLLIQRTDLPTQPVAWTQADADLLQTVAKKVQRIANKLGA
jgi:hypothetical protein